MEAVSNGKKSSILICGAGICGLALGQYLKRFRSDDFEFDILEKDVEFNFRTQGYSLTVQTNGLHALSEIGLLNDLEALIETQEALRGIGQQHYNMDGQITEFDRKDMHVFVPRQKLRNILLKGIESFVKWGKYVEKYEVLSDNEVEVILSGEKEVKKYNCVIDCEGIFSTMRMSLLKQNDLYYSGAVMLNGIVDNVCLEEDRSHVFAGDKKTRLFLKPFTKGKIFWQLTLSEDEVRAKEITLLPFSQQLQLAKEKVQLFKNSNLLEIISKTDQSTFKAVVLYLRLPIDHRDCSQLGLFTFVGDSAHPMPPFKGQGANQGILDSVSLGKILNKANLAGSLREYEESMFARANILQAQSIETFHRYHPKKGEAIGSC